MASALGDRPWFVDLIVRLAAPMILFSIGLLSRVSELRQIVEPSSRCDRPFAAFLVMILVLGFVAPVSVFTVLLWTDYPPFFDLGALIMVCTPGGLASNMFSLALGASGEMNAMLTLTGALIGLGLLPPMLKMAVPQLLQGTAGDVISPLPILLGNLGAIFVPLPCGFLIGHLFPRVRKPFENYLGPVGAILTGLFYLVQLPNVILTMQVTPPAGIVLLSTLFTGQAFLAWLLGSVMRQPSPVRMSMALESGLRDVPLASALIFTCFDGLPATIVTPAASIAFSLGFTVAVPSAIAVLIRTVVVRRAERAWLASFDDAHARYASEFGGRVWHAEPESWRPMSRLGLRWVDVGKMRPVEGREIKNYRLATVLPFRQEFTPDEWEGFGIDDLQDDDFIQSGEVFFKLETSEIDDASILDGCSGRPGRPGMLDMLRNRFVCGMAGRRSCGTGVSLL